ncbi:MAG: TonB-dependent hemoglobin/transferrin/lactoferrin family receptor [Rhodospirillales bacterium]|nr:TonB-dependent hemoglobin/transferrin/lactoferrin family receptor [Rhodospirillales bacterium]
MPSNGVDRVNDTIKRNWTTAGSLGVTRVIAATALGTVLFAFVPINALAQSSDAVSVKPTSEVAQVTLPSQPRLFDIEAQSLGQALVVFSRISGVDVVINGVLPDGAMSPAVNGTMTAAAALDILVSQSGLAWVPINNTTISVVVPQSDTSVDNGAVTLPVTVTASKRALGPNGVPDEVYDTPGSVAVITRESMRKAPVREAREIFNQVAGVDISNDARDPGLTVNVRGQQEMGRVNVNIDGARQNYNQLTHGTASRVYLDPALLAEVEIEKTNLAKNGGAGTSAGIVTMRTLNTDDILDEDEDWGGKVNISHGTNSYDFAGDASAGVRISPKFDMSATVSRKVIGNYRAGNHNPGLFTSGSGTYYSTENSRPKYTFLRQTSGLLKANVYLTEEQELNLGYVGTKSDYAKTNDVANVYTDFNETKTHTLTAKHNWDPVSSLVDLDTNLFWTRTENNQYRPPRYNASGSITHDPYDNYYRVDTAGGDIGNHSKLDLTALGDGLSQLRFDYGTEYFHDKATTRSEIEDLGGTGDYAYQVEGSTPAGQRDVYGGYLTGTYGWNDLFELHGGLRYDRFNLNGDSYWCEAVPNFFGSANQCGQDKDVPLDIDLVEDKVSPSFGVSLSPINGVQLFANYRENFRAPTVMETMLKGSHIGGTPVSFFSNSNLQAEESRTQEIGANFKFDNVLQQGDGFRAKLSYYRTTVDNYITIGYVPTPSLLLASLTGTYQAAGIVNLTDPVYINGTELEMSYDAGAYYVGGTLTTSDMDLEGTYNPYILDTTYTAAALSVANQYGSASSLYGLYAPPERKYTVDGGVRLLDQDLIMGMRASFVYPQDNFGNTTLSSAVGEYFKYRVFDFYSSYDINDNVSLRFAVNNLFDEAYVQGSGGTYSPAPGRTAVVTLSGNF